MGESIVNSLNLHTKVEGGFASVRDVTTMELEDHQHSFFLSETWVHHYLPGQCIQWQILFISIFQCDTSTKACHEWSIFLYRCKYLYLLYDDSFLANQNYIFTTEGHPLPILSSWHERLPEAYIPRNWTSIKVLCLLSLHALVGLLYSHYIRPSMFWLLFVLTFVLGGFVVLLRFVISILV